MKLQEEYTYPLELTHNTIKGRWKPIILWQLGKGKMSLSRLKHDIKRVNQRILLKQLKGLLDSGMVEKESFTGYPLKVEYSLTEHGHKLLEAIVIMQSIGIDLMEENGIFDVLGEQRFI